MKKIALVLVLLLAFGLTAAFAQDEVAAVAEVDGWAKVTWGMDLNSPLSSGFKGQAELTLELNFLKLSKEYPTKGTDEDGPVYGYIKFKKLTFAPEAGVYQTNGETMTEDTDLLDGDNNDILYLNGFEAKIYAKPLYVKIYAQPDVELSRVNHLSQIHGQNIHSDDTGPMRARVNYSDEFINNTAGADQTTSPAEHAGVEVGLDTDMFDVALLIASPYDWNLNVAHAYSIGVKPTVTIGPLGIAATAWISLGYNTYALWGSYGGVDGDAAWDEIGFSAALSLDLLEILGMSEMFNSFKPAIEFDLVAPINGADVAVRPWQAARWQVGLDIPFRLAWNADAATAAADGAEMSLEVTYSDPAALSDLDVRVTLLEDSSNGYIDNLDYSMSWVISDILGHGNNFGAPYSSTLGMDINASINYKMYLDEDETMYIKPHIDGGYDFGVLQQNEDSIFHMKFSVQASFFPLTVFTLKYEAAQLLESQQNYVIAAAGDYGDSWTATLTPMAQQDLGDITVEAKVSY